MKQTLAEKKKNTVDLNIWTMTLSTPKAALSPKKKKKREKKIKN